MFSVVIPVHNKAPHVARSIQSVLDQTYKNFELIIIDDASTDSSMDEVAIFDDPRIRIFQRDEPGPGGYAARNLGIERANAEWIAFLDADDVWNKNHLEHYADLINCFSDTEFFSSGWENYKSDSERYFDPYFGKYGSVSEKCRKLSFNDYLSAQVKGRSPVWTSVVCATKKILTRSGGFPAGKAKRGGDVDTWLRCVEASNGMVWSNHIGAIYYRDSVNMVTKTEFGTARSEMLTVKNMIQRHNKKTRYLLKRFYNRRLVGSWRNNALNGKKVNISLIKNIYYEAISFNNVKYLLLSIFPNSLFKGLRDIFMRYNS